MDYDYHNGPKAVQSPTPVCQVHHCHDVSCLHPSYNAMKVWVRATTT